jgi:hypothetical protein
MAKAPPHETQGEAFYDPKLDGIAADDWAARQAYLVDLAKNGRREDAVLRPTAPIAASTATTAPGLTGCFDRNSLYQPLENRAERYVMPDGSWVWVHPLSISERLDLNLRIAEELRKAGAFKEALDAVGAQYVAHDLQIQTHFRTHVWQAIWVCRQGPGPNSPRVFQPEDADALRLNPGWGEAAEQIAKLSDRLANGQSEAAQMKEALTDFFGLMGSWGETLLSRWNTDSPPASIRSAFSDFVSSVCSMTRRGTPLGAGDLALMRMVLGLPPEDAEPAECSFTPERELAGVG